MINFSKSNFPFPWLVPLGALIFIGLYIYIQKQNSDKSSLSAEVIEIEKGRGNYTVTVKEGKVLKHINYNFFNGIYDIEMGDSLFKKSDSKLLYVKKKRDNSIRLALDQNYIIP
ncbi:MAG: hypothetical protein H7Y86_10075 [Rhizobacter sp.]|nr:hypothetical protein [Ferruginibacter sp.]